MKFNCNSRKVFKLLFLISFVFIAITYRLSSRAYTKTKSPKTVIDSRISYSKTSYYQLYIIVIVYNRYWSLLRLLDSINSAEYDSDRVKLQVWIDRSVNGSFCQITYQTANNFTFKFGDYEVKVHPRHVGIYGQWLTTWVPEPDSKEIAVILEDDLTVSKYFYKYLKLVHEKYDKIPEINGYSLQGTMRGLKAGKRKRLTGPRSSFVFLYPSMGPWGFSPNNRNWRMFLDWFNSPDGFNKTDPFIPGNLASYMYKGNKRAGKGDTMWTIWHRYYAWKKKEYTMFCNFRGHVGLTSNYKESGLHFGHSGRKSNQLLSHWHSEFEDLPEQVPHLDLDGNVIPQSSQNKF